jgi:uncharacterized protein
MLDRHHLTRMGTALLMPLLLAMGLLAPVAHADGPDGGDRGAQWTAAEDGPPRYPSIHVDWNVPITMSDGTVLRANVYRPADAQGPIDTPMPVIMNITPYSKLLWQFTESLTSIPGISDAVIKFFREFDLSGTPFESLTDATRSLGGGLVRSYGVDPALVRSGYVQVVVDVRGTGMSQGVWDLWGPTDERDALEVIDWGARQPWSDGDVGMSGASYSAINQIQAAAAHPPALKAIFPVAPAADLMRGFIAPGGGVIGTMVPWLLAINALKMVPDLPSILHGDLDTTWLADRIASPLTFLDLADQTLTAGSFDDAPQLHAILDPDSPLRRAWLTDPAEIRIPTMIYTGWHDAIGDGGIRLYNELNLPPGRKSMVVGNGYHYLSGFDMRGEHGEPPRLDVLQRAWFDHWLKGIDNGIDDYGPVTVFQQGGGWRTDDRWPLPDAVYRRVYLSADPSGTTTTSVHDGSLTGGSPRGDDRRLTVAPDLSGLCSRDASQATLGLSPLTLVVGCAEDARVNETGGLTFTSPPVAAPTTVSGPIAVHLNTVLDATDGYWAVTVNDVAPDGFSTVLTSGQLTASWRGLDEERSRRSASGDYTDPCPIISEQARRPVVPGEPTALDIGLTPTDALLQPGHRLRVDVFAANFPKAIPLRPVLNDSGLRPQHLDLDAGSPSFVNIPLAGDPGW